MTGHDVVDRKIREFLELRAAPRHLKNEGAKEALRVQIIQVVKDKAPVAGVDAWIGSVIEKAMLRQKGNGWPTPDVWAIAVGAASDEALGGKAKARDYGPGTFGFDLRIFTSRLQSGEPIGELMLFGKVAEVALREQRVSFEQVRARQVAAFNNRKRYYGSAAAFAWLEERSPNLAQDLRAREAARQEQVREPYAD